MAGHPDGSPRLKLPVPREVKSPRELRRAVRLVRDRSLHHPRVGGRGRRVWPHTGDRTDAYGAEAAPPNRRGILWERGEDTDFCPTLASC